MPNWRLSQQAENDIRSIYRTIASDNPAAAERVFMRIMDRIELAAEHPMIGAPRPEFGKMSRILVESPYVILYQPQDGGVFVTTIVHGARDQGNWV